MQIKAIKEHLMENKNFLAGLNVYKGHITYKGVSDAPKYTPAADLLSKIKLNHFGSDHTLRRPF